MPNEPETDFDYLPPAVQLEQAIAFMERRAANSHLLAKADRGENSRYVRAHHMMSAVSIDLILPHARAALEAMKAADRPQLPTDTCPHKAGGCTHTRERFAKRSVCQFGGCPWGGDF